jgi:hypothetical protein
MRFFTVAAALLATAFALEINQVPTSLEAGKTYTITYSPKDNTPTTFILRKGDPDHLDTIGPIGTATGGTFTWTVPKDLANAPNYAFEVTQAGAQPNYSGLIPLTGGSGTASSASASASASGSSTASSSASSTASASTSASASASKSESSKTTPAPSASASMTPGSNSTITSATLSTRTSTSGSSGPTTTGPNSPPAQSTNGAAVLGSSPVALLLGAAAMVYFN